MIQRRQRSQSGATRMMSLVLAVLFGLALGFWVVDRYGDQANAGLRIDRLEQQIARVRALLADLQGKRGSAATLKFSATCPEPWRVMGATAGGLWGCQAPAPAASADSFHPNCNVTRSRIAAGTDPEHYYKTAVSGSPQLSAAKQLGGQAIVVQGRSAYQARFEHRLLGPPMRVLATVFVEGDLAYALTCTAPATGFDAYAAQFLQIAESFELSS